MYTSIKKSWILCYFLITSEAEPVTLKKLKPSAQARDLQNLLNLGFDAQLFFQCSS